jgi:aminopeptidase N
MRGTTTRYSRPGLLPSALALLLSAGLAAAATGGEGNTCACESAFARAGAHAVIPPDPGVDFKHMKLDVIIPDMQSPILEGAQTLTIAGLATPCPQIRLDARLLKINSVSVNGQPVQFEHDGMTLLIPMDPPLAQGAEATIQTIYEVNDPPYGLYWFPETAAWPGRAPQLHTQGQPETNSYWFPCHDFPNEKLTTELIATVPEGFLVSSNGKLISERKAILTRQTAGGSSELAGYDRFHFVQDKPHANYLVSMIVGKFDVVDVGVGAMPMPVFAPPGSARDIKPCYGKTAAMIDFFSQRLSEPYPWDKYAQIVVCNTVFGGMENTSATTMWEGAIADRAGRVDTDLEGLISHELAHQWFGDLVTCDAWEHVWLNEGWATYMTGLWFEHSKGRAAYEEYIRGRFDDVISQDEPKAPELQPMASNVYEDPWETFRRKSNPYGKGCSILHMLRERLGDAAFFRGVAAYLDQHKFQSVETDHFRQSLEEASGDNLEQFFAQWVRRPGVPVLKIRCDAVPVSAGQAGTSLSLSDTLAGKGSNSSVTIRVEQTQNIDTDNPPFTFDLPVLVKTSGADPFRVIVHVTGKTAEVSDPRISGTVQWIAVDPDMTTLAKVELEQDPSAWAALLKGGPTVSTRVLAARAMDASKSERAAQSLLNAAVSRSENLAVRLEAIKGLGAAGRLSDVESLSGAAFDRWELRDAVVNAMVAAVQKDKHAENTLAAERVVEHLAKRATSDQSTTVRASAIRGLGTLGAKNHFRLIASAAQTDSQEDRLRRAAIDALVAFDEPQSFAIVEQLTQEGNFSRTRPEAIKAVAKLSKHDKDKAFAAIARRLNDREARTRDTAGEQLIVLADPRGIKALEDLLAETRDPGDKKRVEKWLGELKAKGDGK